MKGVLSRIGPPEGARQSERRVGRGPGGGKGKTSGKGMKGQKARNPGNFGKTHFQGGQTPMQRRLPKRGFRNPFSVVNARVNVADLERFDSGSTIDEEVLRSARLVQGRDKRIKVLSGGELTKKLTVSAHAFSAQAKQQIEAAGGKTVIVPWTAPSAEKAAS